MVFDIMTGISVDFPSAKSGLLGTDEVGISVLTELGCSESLFWGSSA